MIRRLVGYILLALLLMQGGCVVYDHQRGYYNYPHYRSPGYHYWGPPIHFRFHYYRGWHGLNQEDNSMYPVFRVEYWDTPFMCVDPEYVETLEGQVPSVGTNSAS